jgi:hypothetical protein
MSQKLLEDLIPRVNPEDWILYTTSIHKSFSPLEMMSHWRDVVKLAKERKAEAWSITEVNHEISVMLYVGKKKKKKQIVE